MPLRRNLFSATLAHACPHCGGLLRKKGSWFARIASYRCPACHRQVAMRYSMKLTLFDASATRDEDAGATRDEKG
jgi:transposase-like protein